MDWVHRLISVVLSGLGSIPKIGIPKNYQNEEQGKYRELGRRASEIVPVIADGITMALKGGVGRNILSKLQKTNFLVKSIKKKETRLLNSANGLVKDGARLIKPFDYEQACECVKEKGKEYFGKGKCFTGDTLIYGEHGYVPIIDIKEGDLVWSMEEETGETGLKQVEAVFCTGAHTIHEIEVEGSKVIRTTAYHPFYVAKQGWVDAINLQKGDILVTADGIAEITGVSKCRYDDAVKTYNFHVEDWTSYFVTDWKIYVHNPIGEHEERFNQMHQGEMKSALKGEVIQPFGMAIPVDRIPDLASQIIKLLGYGAKFVAGVATVVLTKPETPVLNRGEEEALKRSQRKKELEKIRQQQAENATKDILKLKDPSVAELRNAFKRNGIAVDHISDENIVTIGKLISDSKKEPKSKKKENEGKGQTSSNKGGSNKKPTPEIIAGIISQIPNSLKQNGQCDKFARALAEKLSKLDIVFDIIRVDSKVGEIIYSDKLKDMISRNSYHYGIRIGDIIYDNLTTKGMKFQDWIADLGGNAYIVWKTVNEIISH